MIRSPFIDKDSQEQFEIRTHKRLIDVLEPSGSTIRCADASESSRRRRYRDQAVADGAGRRFCDEGVDTLCRRTGQCAGPLPGRQERANDSGMVGKKLGMTQIFDETGLVHPVTVLEVGPCVVTQIKTAERDGYEAVQLGFGLDKRLNRPERGIAQASGFMSRTLREVKADDTDGHRGRPGHHRRCFRRGRVGRCDRHLEGPRLPGCGQAPRLPRRPENARSVRPPSRARLDRLERHAGPRVQGHADGGAHGQRRVTVQN